MTLFMYLDVKYLLKRVFAQRKYIIPKTYAGIIGLLIWFLIEIYLKYKKEIHYVQFVYLPGAMYTTIIVQAYSVNTSYM